MQVVYCCLIQVISLTTTPSWGKYIYPNFTHDEVIFVKAIKCWILALQIYAYSNPQIRWQEGLIDLTKVRTLRWEGYSYVSRPNVISSPYKGRARGLDSEKGMGLQKQRSLSLSHTHTEILREKYRERLVDLLMLCCWLWKWRAMECRRPLEVENTKNYFFPSVFRRNTALLTSWF